MKRLDGLPKIIAYIILGSECPNHKTKWSTSIMKNLCVLLVSNFSSDILIAQILITYNHLSNLSSLQTLLLEAWLSSNVALFILSKNIYFTHIKTYKE